MYFNIEDYKKHIISELISIFEEYQYNRNIASVALCGSFGRDEPTFVLDSQGSYSLQSDIEVAVIIRKNRKQVEKWLSGRKKNLKEDYGLMPISERRVRRICNFNYTLIPQKYKTIFTYDLYNGSKTIWGEKIIESIKLGIEKCDKYEAKRLVANRIGELTYIRQNAAGSNYTREVQWKSKLMLAIAGAWLICKGIYSSSYHGQYKLLNDRADELSGSLGNCFLQDYNRCFSFLRDNGEIYEIEENSLRQYVNRINNMFDKLRINKSRVNSTSRYIKYLKKYMKTGMKYGIVGFEENILQTLIDSYISDDKDIIDTSKVWYDVLH